MDIDTKNQNNKKFDIVNNKTERKLNKKKIKFRRIELR